MPKLILATATTLLLGRSTTSARSARDGYTAAQEAVHARTRSREATRRLRSPGTHEQPYLDLGPLDLAERH
jgi:hypothetical protein